MDIIFEAKALIDNCKIGHPDCEGGAFWTTQKHPLQLNFIGQLADEYYGHIRLVEDLDIFAEGLLGCTQRGFKFEPFEKVELSTSCLIDPIVLKAIAWEKIQFRCAISAVWNFSSVRYWAERAIVHIVSNTRRVVFDEEIHKAARWA